MEQQVAQEVYVENNENILKIDEKALDEYIAEEYGCGLTLKQRIGDNTINLTNYNKHDQQKSGRKTGTALLNNKVNNLSVIDIDINKELDNDTKDKIRNNILSKLSDDDTVITVKINSMIIGKITSIIDNNTVSVFKG